MQNPVDVLVVGAGPSGLMAAMAAAREGAQVRLIERTGLLGGMNTGAMVGPLMAFHAGKTQIVRGLAQDVVGRMLAAGGCLGHIPDPLGVAGSITPFEPAVLGQVYFQMLREYPNIELLLHTALHGVTVDGDTIRSVATWGKDGMREHRAACYIDATGDGDLFAMAGVPFSVGRPQDGLSQPMTLLFKLGGVDFDAVRAAVRARPDQFVLGPSGAEMGYVAISGYFEAVAQARAEGLLTLDRDRVLLFEGVRRGEALVNMTRVVRHSALDAASLSSAEVEGRRQVDEVLRFLVERIDGFSGAYIAESGDYIGVRESRHLQGAYTVTEADVVGSAAFDDSVAMCAFPIDIHDPAGKGLVCAQTGGGAGYDIPYRAMVPAKVQNLLVTGRCVSATHEAAASLRITPTAMALGEAAGIAAAQCARESRTVPAVDVASVQESIRRHGGICGRMDVEWIF